MLRFRLSKTYGRCRRVRKPSDFIRIRRLRQLRPSHSIKLCAGYTSVNASIDLVSRGRASPLSGRVVSGSAGNFPYTEERPWLALVPATVTECLPHQSGFATFVTRNGPAFRQPACMITRWYSYRSSPGCTRWGYPCRQSRWSGRTGSRSGPSGGGGSCPGRPSGPPGWSRPSAGWRS